MTISRLARATVVRWLRRPRLKSLPNSTPSSVLPQRVPISRRACLAGAGLILAACHGASQPPAASATTATIADIDEGRARDLIAALAVGSADLAETNFNQRMRSALPPQLLLAQWQGLQTRHGAFASWRIVNRDHPVGRNRFTFELVFSQRVIYCMVVVEPSTHEVIGLFFAKTQHEANPGNEPDPAVHEETLSVGPLALPASWALPVAARPPLPAVLLVSGSGANDRDESIAVAKPFRDLAYGLAKRGIATLRYDNRSFAHPELSPDPGRATVEDEVLTDAVAALQLLRKRPEVDPERVFVVGHSLGALLTPEIAQRGGGVAGLVLLAAPGRPLEQIVLEQLKAMQPGADFSGLERQVQALPNLPAATPLLGMSAGYWRDLDRRDEMAIAVALGRPVLLLRGSVDRNVAAVDHERWLSALSGRVSVKSDTLPGLNHFLLSATETAGQRHVAPEAIAAIAGFIQQP